MGNPLEDSSERKMYVYNSYEDFLMTNLIGLRHNPMKLAGISAILLTEEEKKRMSRSLTQILVSFCGFETSRDEEPLHINIPGEKLGDYEAAVAHLKKSRKTSKGYLVPVDIYVGYLNKNNGNTF